MRDLVETVIGGILQRERMQQHAQDQLRAAVKPGSAPTHHINKTRLHASGSQLPASNKARDPALWKVSKQFESIFVQQMMSEMRDTVQKSDFLPHGFAEDVHGSMMDAAIAQASVNHHSLGIADNIYRQLEAAQSRTSQPESSQTKSKQAESKQVESKQAESKQAGDQQAKNTYAISISADTLKDKHNVALEVNKHAY